MGRLVAFLALLSALVVVPAQAEQLVYASDVDAILEVTRNYGEASLSRDSQGDPKISATMEGVKYIIFFYGCTNGANCDSIQFYTGWSDGNSSTEHMNEWNRTKRFGIAFRDSKGNARLKMNLNMDGGAPYALLEDQFNWWKTAVKQFSTHIH